MSNSRKGRWYIRKENKVYGPFPNKLIGRYLILGRITLQTEVSQDKQHWSAVESYPAMVPEVVKEAGTPEGDKALMLARVREDERSSSSAHTEGEQDADERRDEEEPLLTLHRQLRDDVLKQGRTETRKRPMYIILVALLLVVFLVISLSMYMASQSKQDARLTDCQALAEPGINWAGCQKQGESLRNRRLNSSILRNAKLQMADLSSTQLQQADLAYADLSGAILVGAQLQQANLKGANLQRANFYAADLSGANLSYAELLGARLEEATLYRAVFDHAIWVNGEKCLPGSVGACLLASPQE